MPKPTKGPRLGGSPSHQRLILANLATELFAHGKITTTLTRAKRMQPLAEHLITKAKNDDQHSVRLVRKTITNIAVLHHLFHEIGPAMADRNGGYTRITKLGPRKGDGAEMALIEIITEKVTPKKKPSKAKPVDDDLVDEVLEDEADEADEADGDEAETDDEDEVADTDEDSEKDES